MKGKEDKYWNYALHGFFSSFFPWGFWWVQAMYTLSVAILLSSLLAACPNANLWSHKDFFVWHWGQVARWNKPTNNTLSADTE